MATLLAQGIDVSVVNKLINNNADLRDIAVNSQILLNRGIRVDLINEWLGNKTHLNDAITIINRGVDLNLVGTSNKVGDLTDLMGAHPNEIVSRIPADAKIERWKPNPTKVQEGMKFIWQDVFGNTWRLEMHGPDLNPALPAWSNAARGWILRIKYKKQYMDAGGTFYKETIENHLSPNYDPAAINATHIPIQDP